MMACTETTRLITARNGRDSPHRTRSRVAPLDSKAAVLSVLFVTDLVALSCRASFYLKRDKMPPEDSGKNRCVAMGRA
jgi:hypothetical protein